MNVLFLQITYRLKTATCFNFVDKSIMNCLLESKIEQHIEIHINISKTHRIQFNNNADIMQILSIHRLGRGCYRQKVLNSTIEQVTLLIFCIWYLREEIKLMVNIFFLVQKCERYFFCYIFKISERFVLNKSDITYTMISHLKSPSII